MVAGCWGSDDERCARRRRADRRKAVTLFRIWHEMQDMVREAERLGDGELVHLLAVTQLLVEERAAASGPDLAEPVVAVPN